MRRLLSVLVIAAPLALPIAAMAKGDALPARHTPGHSRMAASDALGGIIWPRVHDAVPKLAVALKRPEAGGVHLTTGTSEELAEWLEQWGEIESGPGPKR